VAVGDGALSANASGIYNTAIGSRSLYYNHNDQNTGVGRQALYSFFNGSRNTAIGDAALLGDIYTLSSGVNNTASGASALYSDTSGSYNVASGESALSRNTTGSRNIAVGQAAGINLTTGNDNIDIGNAGVAGESGIIRIGTAGTQRAMFVAGVSDAVLAGGTPVVISKKGRLGIQVSSARFKDNIQPMTRRAKLFCHYSQSPFVTNTSSILLAFRNSVS
jgi:hypothetical protein